MSSPYRTVEVDPPPNDYLTESMEFRALVDRTRRRDLTRSMIVKAVYVAGLTFFLALFYAVLLHLLVT